jgi:hypothetical protein
VWVARRPSATDPHLGPHAGSLPSSSPTCPRSCNGGAKPMAFGESSELVGGSPL